jgi:arsenate reductase (thioredoxin)
MTKQTVLFLCTGNSCRSQMAEGLVNHYLSESWQAVSAGTEPSGYVHPLAVAAMGELGIDISAGRSKNADEFRALPLDVVITVCDDAAENCPLWLGQGQVVHHAFYDPAKAEGSHEERMVVFRQVRDEIKDWVIPFLSSR